MERKYWFKPKKFFKIFAAFYPVAWQGWLVVVAVLVAFVKLFMASDEDSHSVSDTLIRFAPRALIVLIFFDILTLVTGEYPAWWRKRISKTDDHHSNEQDEWRGKLTPEQYNVCRLGATESPFSGRYVHHKENGMYICAACGAELFSSATKFESGTGWPSFSDVAKQGTVELKEDRGHGMTRTEVRCKNCGSHLGHVFDDGPTPTGKRYCINSVALDFTPKEK